MPTSRLSLSSLRDRRQKSLGARGEALAAEHFERLGYTVLARNHRTRFGELDLIVRDGDALVFVEVKTRHAGNRRGPERPAMAVGRTKQRKLRALALAWLSANRGRIPRHSRLRFDVVGIVLDSSGEPLEWDWIEAAF
jgi:putative endonuclease